MSDANPTPGCNGPCADLECAASLRKAKRGIRASNEGTTPDAGVLMLATTTPGIAGKLRDLQNWIGDNRFNPGQADFVPPPPEYVPDLMKDLAAFLNRSDMPALVQAAIAHAQFETIHPFADGNGASAARSSTSYCGGASSRPDSSPR